MSKISEIASYLESYAPLSYQESYDNAGLIVGDPDAKINGILICLDTIESVIDEAIAKKCNLVVSHHPVIFRGLKKLNGSNYVERSVIKAIKNDIAIYAIHTNLDNVSKGVSYKIAEKICLKNVRILRNKTGTLKKLVTFVPIKDTDQLLSALHQAGVGIIGNYQQCSFIVEGVGTFMPYDQAKPHIGKKGILEKIQENRIEVIFPSFLHEKIVETLKEAHPYEEVAYYITTLDNENQDAGAGAIGELEKPIAVKNFLLKLKDQMKLQCIRHSPIFDQFSITRVAVCGGAGSFLLKDAIRKKADVFITADFKYHEFFDAENKIVIADIGHYESEVFTKELIFEILNKKFTNIALVLSKVVTNPINYL